MREKIEIVTLAAALALGAGEGLAAAHPTACGLWPALFALTALVALAGYGFAVRGWPFLSVFIIGMALFWHAARVREEGFRETPWMRNARVHEKTASSQGICWSIRRDFARRIAIGLDPRSEVASLNRAILLGERASVPRDLKRAFVDAGTVHVFAISGLHVMVVAQTLMFALALIFVPLRAQGPLVMLPVWGYVVLIGAPPSAVRAALMASVYFAAPLFGRKPNGLLAWAQTFLAVHVLNPLQITDVGSQFSFAVMLALIVGGRLARNLSDAWRKNLFLTFLAWAAGVPIAAYAFARLTLGSLVANPLVIGLAGGSVSAGVMGLLASFASTTLAAHCNRFAALMTEAMMRISETVAALPISSFEIPRWGLAECLEWTLALVLSIWLLKERSRDARSCF